MLFYIALLFILWQAWGMLQQVQTIRTRRSGKALSVVSLSVNAAYFFNAIIYGIRAERMAIAISGVLLWPLLLCALALIARYDRWPAWKMLAQAGMVSWCIGAYALETGAGELFSGISALTVGISLMQPLKMLREQSAGSVDVRLSGSFLAGSVFWCLYGFITQDTIIFVSCAIFCCSHLATIALWYRYR